MIVILRSVRAQPALCRRLAAVAAVAVSVLVTAVVLAGCTTAAGDVKTLQVQNRTLEQRVAELEEQLRGATSRPIAAEKPAVPAGQPQAPTAAPSQAITLYFVRNTPTELWLVPEARSIVTRADLPRAAMEELIKGPTGPGLASLIPLETKVLGVTVQGHVANANFSKDLTRMSVGSRGEALVVAAIANTLIKLPGIEKMRLLVEGKPVESLAGHVDVTGPLGRSEAMLLLDSAAAGR